MAEYPPREAQESRCCWECGAEEAEKNSQERPTKMLPHRGNEPCRMQEEKPGKCTCVQEAGE